MAIKGIPLPLPRLGVTPAANSKLFFWQPGTTTKQNAYTDETLATPLSNPLSADSAGLFPAIYLDPALGYKVALYPSTETNDPPTGTATFSQDNLYLPAASYLFAPVCQGRLTLTSGTPVTTADVTAATTLYFALYGGNRLALYNSTKAAWELHTFAELSITLVGLTASTPYDVFVYSNSGTPTLELTAWTNATTRATALTTQDGVLVKNGTTTRRYLGTIYINSSGGQTDDSLTKRFVWNYYHRVRRPMARLESTDTWTYTTATFREMNGSTSNRLQLVVGVAEVGLDVQVVGHAQHSAGGVNAAVAIGEDSTTTVATNTLMQQTIINVTSGFQSLAAALRKTPAIGFHFYAALETVGAASGTMTWAGDAGVNYTQSGIVGSLEG